MSGQRRRWVQLSTEEQASLVKTRLAAYSRRVYNRTHVVTEEVREATVCQRENSFYVDTVRAFRDRRYVYKKRKAIAARAAADARAEGNTEEAVKQGNLVVLWDSMQLAHKCILNSFYGYVMRRGARWYSMEMAGLVTYTGAEIIKLAKELVDGVGKPLELDTDGIWCTFPASFPDEYELRVAGAKKPVRVSFPGAVLNRATEQKFSNYQYQERRADGTYDVRVECSIEFEVDGPYKAMILPAANVLGKGGEQKRLKKRYAVFDERGRMVELKGFEMKRRGELKLIKVFQEEVFGHFLDGETLADCYDAVGTVANAWLDTLDDRGHYLEEPEILSLLMESSNMSRALSAYA